MQETEDLTPRIAWLIASIIIFIFALSIAIFSPPLTLSSDSRTMTIVALGGGTPLICEPLDQVHLDQYNEIAPPPIATPITNLCFIFAIIPSALFAIPLFVFSYVSLFLAYREKKKSNDEFVHQTKVKFYVYLLIALMGWAIFVWAFTWGVYDFLTHGPCFYPRPDYVIPLNIAWHNPSDQPLWYSVFFNQCVFKYSIFIGLIIGIVFTILFLRSWNKIKSEHQ